MSRGTTLVLGVGNESRGDDAAGIAVARRIRERRVRGVVVREAGPDAMLILDAWDGADSVVIVDAMSSGLEPGSVRRFDGAAPIPARTFAPSTHALGVPQAIELGRALQRLPGRLVVIGIEGERFDHGAGLSPVVEAAVDRAVDRVLQEVAG
jgi:hydrogenase maturation protease